MKYSTLERTIESHKPCKDEFGHRPDYRCEYCGCMFEENYQDACPQCNTTAYQLNENYPHVLKARKRRMIATKHRTELAA